jgi:hypothetical protein
VFIKTDNQDVIPNEERNPADFANVQRFLGGPPNDNAIARQRI